MLNMKKMVGTHNILFITLDTLRYDAACTAMEQGRTPRLRQYLPFGRWELRDSPASFTFAAHHAFFAGFLPTRKDLRNETRLFAAAFPGSETTGEETFCFPEADIVTALAGQGYATICIGGVGFFNQQTRLGSVFPALFQESHWSPEMGVTSPCSTRKQAELAAARLAALPADQRVFLFINVSATHQPNCIFSTNRTEDSVETQTEALAYADPYLGDIIHTMAARGPLFCIICSDHGTAYGEDGLWGHRVNHPVVWNVPYAHFVVEQEKAR